MTATQTAILQIVTGGVIVVVGVGFIGYLVGIDRIVRHPLQSIETVLAVGMSWLPARKPSRVRKHYRGRHAK